MGHALLPEFPFHPLGARPPGRPSQIRPVADRPRRPQRRFRRHHHRRKNPHHPTPQGRSRRRRHARPPPHRLRLRPPPLRPPPPADRCAEFVLINRTPLPQLQQLHSAQRPPPFWSIQLKGSRFPTI